MEAFRSLTGRMAPLDRANVDTDQIIPKQFLKRIERSGFGPYLFYDWRREDPDFVLNRPQYQGASVLVTGANFGCGSSREHAPWSLEDAGFRAVIAPSFADIFRNNCHKVGVLPVELPEASVRRLIEIAEEDPTASITVDLERQVVSTGDLEEHFDVDPFVRESLINGWDDIARTLLHDEEIGEFEGRRPAFRPSVAAQV
ncbi:MAG TPA: 3-isopropylmalate dehydratase small subunit [Candidatus Dormibacteraeota bacterium]|jgi:3-isopropylmalate/(R)-2-methylmalate dehydratase small subunit|nr:3-isopropylmalate dehydratase small subunit [Candidatus Dormibacteraeota bacterium]